MNKKIYDKLVISDQWSRYFKQYAHGSTVIEQLIHWISTTNNLIKNVNDWNEYLEKFVLSFDEKLQETVRNDISELEKNGFLGLIIDEFINKKSNEIDNTLEEFNSQLEQTAIKGADTPVNVLDFKHLVVDNDWTSAIQEALDNHNSVFIPKGHTYNISQTIHVPDNKKLILEGNNARLRSEDNNAVLTPISDVDVVSLGDCSSLLGGVIATYKVTGFSKSCVKIDFTTQYRYNNEVTTTLIGTGSGYGVHLYGNGDGGEGFGGKINSDWIAWFDTGIKGEQIRGNAWYTGLFIDATIMNCVQAVNTNVGVGGKISGSLQPLVKSGDLIHSEDRALVELNVDNMFVDAFFWDINTALNKYSIHMREKSNDTDIYSVNTGTILDERKYPYKGKNRIERKKDYKLYPATTLHPNQQFSGMQDNLLFGAHKKFDVNITSNNVENITNKHGVFTGDSKYTHIALWSDQVETTVTYEIVFDEPKNFQEMGVIFNGGYTPANLKMSRKVNGTYRDIYNKNPNDELYNGKNHFGVPVIFSFEYLDAPIKVESIKFEFTINDTIDGKNIIHIMSLFYKDGTTENYLPSYGGNLYGDLLFRKGSPVISSPDGTQYKLIVNNDGTLSTTTV